MAGKIIVIEGTESSGKETQSKLLEKRLNDNNIKCIRFEFPMYDTPTGRIVGGPYLGKDGFGDSYFDDPEDADPRVICLYYAADRKYNMPKILEYLDKDYYVILDRYTTSNLAHQGSKIRDKDERFNTYQWIDKLEYWLLGLPKPDKTIFLHVPFEKTIELSGNRFTHEKSTDHLKNAEAAYLELQELYNWDKIECVKNNELRSVEEINDEIYNMIINEYK